MELGKIMEDLNKRSKEDSLKMNLKKIKILTNALETPGIVGNTKIDYCPEYTYLGQTISMSSGGEKDIQTTNWTGQKQILVP